LQRYTTGECDQRFGVHPLQSVQGARQGKREGEKRRERKRGREGEREREREREREKAVGGRLLT
jgi:hypothetical protein